MSWPGPWLKPGDVLTLKAHAKVNLGLHVLGRRADGFHDIDTLFARLELHDTLTLEPRRKGVSLEVEGADLPGGGANLAYRAARLYLERAAGAGGVRLGLTKRIPVAAGLGGGSSDAAAVLRGLAALYPSDLELLELAAQLGSDVPFFADDLGAARAQGRGERLAPLALPVQHLVLANPGVPVSAGDAYRAVRSYDAALPLEAVLSDLRAGRSPSYTNTLQPGVVGLEPAVGEVVQALRATGLYGVLMSGSGSTCFGLARDSREAQGAAARLAERYPAWWVSVTRTAP